MLTLPLQLALQPPNLKFCLPTQVSYVDRHDRVSMQIEKVHPPLFIEIGNVQNLGSFKVVIRPFLKIHT